MKFKRSLLPLKQELREDYMERTYNAGYYVSELTEQANKWWPGTVETEWERIDRDNELEQQ